MRSASAYTSAAATDMWMCSTRKGTPTAARPTSRRYPAHELRCLFPNSTGFSSPLAPIPATQQPSGYFAQCRELRRNLSSNVSTVRDLRRPCRQTWLTYTSRTCDCRRSSRPTRHKPALNGPLQHQGDRARLPRREQPAAHSGGDGSGRPHRIPAAAADMGHGQIAGARMRFPSRIHYIRRSTMMRRSLMLVIAVGLATLGSSIAWSEDSDQAALIKALDGAKLTPVARHRSGRQGDRSAHRSKIPDGTRQTDAVDLYLGEGLDTAAEDN